MEEDVNWYYQKKNSVAVRGLVDQKSLLRMLRRKQLQSEDLVWVTSGGQGYWRPLRSVEQFQQQTGRFMTWVLFVLFLLTFLLVIIFNQHKIVLAWTMILGLFS